MTDNQVRLLDGPFSKGIEALTRLSRSSLFTSELATAICAKKGNEDLAVQAMRDALLSPAAPIGHLVHLDLSLSYPEMIRLGYYTNEKQAIREITEELFPINRTGELQYEKELFLEPPSRNDLTTTEWKAELEANGWELEQAPELLALGAQYSELQRDHYIVAFGSSWTDPDGTLKSPVLWSDGSCRGAYTDWYSPGNHWYLHGRALVSRKRR
jgi:hypothetical protein